MKNYISEYDYTDIQQFKGLNAQEILWNLNLIVIMQTKGNNCVPSRPSELQGLKLYFISIIKSRTINARKLEIYFETKRFLMKVGDNFT